MFEIYCRVWQESNLHPSRHRFARCASPLGHEETNGYLYIGKKYTNIIANDTQRIANDLASCHGMKIVDINKKKMYTSLGLSIENLFYSDSGRCVGARIFQHLLVCIYKCVCVCARYYYRQKKISVGYSCKGSVDGETVLMIDFFPFFFFFFLAYRRIKIKKTRILNDRSR